MSFSQPEPQPFIPPPPPMVEDEDPMDSEAARQSRRRDEARVDTASLRVNPSVSTPGSSKGGGVFIPNSR